MRVRPALSLLALLVVSSPLWNTGCGSKFDLPTERRAGRSVPQNQSYAMIGTWHVFSDPPPPGRGSLAGIQDILLTQGSGSQLFLLFNDGGTGVTSRGFITDVAITRPLALGHTFQTLFNPHALCAGGDGGGGTANRIYVLDRGDTCLAKTPNGGSTCTPLTVTHLELYWRVREYGLLGGDTLSSFTDLNLAWVNGVASDVLGNVYVSGVAVVFTPSSDPRLTLRTFRYVVYKYARGPRYPGIVDPSMPGARWHRDSTYVHTEGNGVGYVKDPRGLAWTGYGQQGLFVADLGNNSGQKLSDVDSTGFVRYEQDGDGMLLSRPEDIAVDPLGFVYVADTGNSRVLRFTPGGSYIQRVDVAPDDNTMNVVNPVAVAANDSLVYVADRGLNEVVRYLKLK